MCEILRACCYVILLATIVVTLLSFSVISCLVSFIKDREKSDWKSILLLTAYTDIFLPEKEAEDEEAYLHKVVSENSPLSPLLQIPTRPTKSSSKNLLKSSFLVLHRTNSFPLLIYITFIRMNVHVQLFSIHPYHFQLSIYPASQLATYAQRKGEGRKRDSLYFFLKYT